MRRALPFAALVLCGALLRADGLADLKSALKNVPAPAKVRMKVEEHSTEREDGKDRTERRTVVVEDGPEGPQIIEDSRPAVGSGSKKGGSKGPGGKRNGDFREALRPAKGLLEQLEEARLVEEKVEPYEGRPARRLKLALDLGMDAEARSHIKQADHEATVWIGQDGLPLAMNHHLEVKARVLLFASVWTKVDIQRRFQRHQGRLFLQEEQADVQGSALGKAFSAKEISRFTLLP